MPFTRNPAKLLWSRKFAALSGAILISLSVCLQIRAADNPAPPHGKPDVKAWKSSRAQGQKALEQKNYAEAEASFKIALDAARNFGPKDDRLVESLVDLANVEVDTKNLAAAEPLLREAAEIRHDDPDPVLEARCLYEFALVSEELGHYDDVAKSFQRAEELFSRKLGPNHPMAVLCAFRRGTVYFKQGDYAQAEPLLKHSFNLFRNPATRISLRNADPAVYGLRLYRTIRRPNYAYALEAASLLSVIYIHENRPAEAESSLKDSLKLVDEYAGNNDPAIPEVLKGLSAFYFSMTNYAATDPILERLAKFQQKNLGETNEATLATQSSLARVYELEKKNTEAEALYGKIATLTEKASGPESRETAAALAQLAKFYVTIGEYEKAEPLYRRQLVLAEKYQGGGVALMPILSDLIIVDTKLGRDADLEAICKQQIAVIEKMFGANTPALIKPLTDCAALLRKEKRDAEAEPLEVRANGIKASQNR